MLLTRHQYPALYTSMISQFGPLFHAHGVPMLETACHNIASWYVASLSRPLSPLLTLGCQRRQSPSPGATVELGFLGSVLQVELPLTSDSQQLAETNTFDEQFNPAVHVSTPRHFYLALLTDRMGSFSHPLDHSTRHQYSCLKRRWRTYGRCGSA